MNIVQLQDQLKNFSQDQLVREMQMPSGSAPQFLVLGEIMRRQKMQQDFTAQQAKGDQGTVAQEAIAAAGVPQGGIADMARAMAPSTDMTQNTGVQAMYAGGPVKKMAAGDKVNTDPAVIAYANKLGMSVDEYLASLGEEEAARIEAGAEQRAARNRMMAMEPVAGKRASYLDLPTQADLDANYRASLTEEPRFRQRPYEQFPEAGGLASIPQSLYPPVPVGNPIPGEEPSYYAPPERAQPMSPMERIRFLQGPSFEGEGRGNAVAPTPVVRTAPRAAGIGSASYVPGPVGGGVLAGVVDPVMTGLGDLAYGLSGETIADYEARKAAAAEAAAAETPMPSRADRDQQGIAAIPTEAEVVEAEKVAAEEKAAADAAAAAAQPTSQGGGTGGAGAAGGAAGASSYEQALMDALSSREKAAQQDKWLALAQVGLNLMSSTQPTLGGALGEAGLKGVEAARGARDQYDKEKLEILGALEQSRAARAKAARSGSAASGGGLGGISAGQGRLFTQINADIERLDTILNNPMLMGAELTPEDEMQIASARQQRDALLAYRQQLLYGAPLDTGEDETSADLADQ
jgi:hypothetical protein